MGGGEQYFWRKQNPLIYKGFKEMSTVYFKYFVDLLGLEPRLTEPKSGVLPLHHRSKAPQK